MSKLDIIIEPIQGEVLRYYCSSQSVGREGYIVDLSEYGGNGSCSCPSFEIRKSHNIRKGMTLFTSNTRCKHVNQAVKIWADSSLEFFSKILHDPQYQNIREQAMLLLTQINKDNEQELEPNGI